MDTNTSINNIRSQFLRVCPQKDQIRRIIKPSDSKLPRMYNYDDLDESIKAIYTNEDGSCMLSELNSPPIMTHYMDNYGHLGIETRPKENSRGINQETDLGSTLTKRYNFNADEDTSILKGDTMFFNQIESVKANNEIQPNINHQQTINILSPASDSDTDSDDSKKRNRRPALPFTKMFKGRKDVTNNQPGKKVGTDHIRQNSAVKRHSKYSMNFDYDENLDEDDEDDEDENEEDSNLQSQFFQMDKRTKPSRNHSNTTSLNDRTRLSGINGSFDSGYKNGIEKTNASNSGAEGDILNGNSITISSGGSNINSDNTNNNDNTNSSNIISGNVSRLKSHLQQIPILDNSRNINASKSESINYSKDPLPKDQSGEISNSNNNIDVKPDDSDLSDIESYMNEDELNNLSLDMIEPNNSKGLTLTPETPKRSEFQSSTSALPSARLSESESQDLSDVSSFGKSLLESEYSSTEFLKKTDSSINDEILSLDTDIIHHTVSSNSITNSFEGYGLYRGTDDSTLNNVLDKAVSNIKSSKSSQGRERRGSNASRRSSITQTISSKRMSFSSNNTMKQAALRNQIRSSSNNSTEVGKNGNSLATSLHKSKNAVKTDYFKSTLSQTSDHISRRSSRDLSLLFDKVTLTPNPENSSSQLSSLFNKKKHKVTNPSDALEYFSFVSGSTVPRFEGMEIEVYIQASKKYKHSSFKTKVRKNAKIFEVIGFILYLYSTKYKPENFELDGLSMSMLIDPNNFSLKIVDEDGEPFEDNFGKLNRTSLMESISDNEVVLCKVSEEEKVKNESETPIPYDVNGDIIEYAKSTSSNVSVNYTDGIDTTINQLSFYKPIVGNIDDLTNSANSSNVIEVTVYKYPNINPKFNFTTVNVLVTGNINDILVKYCRMKNMDPNKYVLKVIAKNLIFDLNDTVLRLDGNNKVEIVSKTEARKLQLEKIKPNMTKPQLPTIQSNDLTPMTLEAAPSYLKSDAPDKKGSEAVVETKGGLKVRKTSGKIKLNTSKQTSSGNSSFVPAGGSFFKIKNSSKSSLQNPLQLSHLNHSGTLNEYSPENLNGNNFQDLLSGAYHKYRVWRRQQMSLITKHERTLALDGDYVYIVPPEGKMHWHENVKTKSFHISQVVLVKKSKRVAEYFKIYVRKGPEDIKRYYFEAISVQECNEIVSRINNLLSAYKMNHK